MSEFFDILVRFVAQRRSQEEESDSWLTLEQAPLKPAEVGNFKAWFQETYGGDWSKYDFASGMAFWEEFRSLCNESGDFTAEIRVNKSTPDLQYKLDATKGSWKYRTPQVESDQRSTRISINGESSYTITNEAVSRIVCAQWEGNVYGENRELLLPKPTISVDGAALDFGGVFVTGTIRTVYLVDYDVWWLVISPQGTSGDSVQFGELENPGEEEQESTDGSFGSPVCSDTYDDEEDSTLYATTVYAVYDGGIEKLEVKTPDLIGRCKKDSHTGPDEEDAECYKLVVKYQKCTGEKISEELIPVPCPDEG